MAQDRPGHVETEFLPDLGRGRMAETMWAPMWHVGFVATPEDRPSVAFGVVSLPGLLGCTGSGAVPLTRLDLTLPVRPEVGQPFRLRLLGLEEEFIELGPEPGPEDRLGRRAEIDRPIPAPICGLVGHGPIDPNLPGRF